MAAGTAIPADGESGVSEGRHRTKDLFAHAILAAELADEALGSELAGTLGVWTFAAFIAESQAELLTDEGRGPVGVVPADGCVGGFGGGGRHGSAFALSAWCPFGKLVRGRDNDAVTGVAWM